MKKLLLQYVSYNFWANERIVGVLDQLDKEVLDQQLISSFPNLRSTMYHIWDAEIVWINRLKNIRIGWPPSLKFDIALPLHTFIDASKEFISLVSSEGEGFFSQFTTYKNQQGKEFTQPNSEILMHCMNHSTFHRGQIITMLRKAGYNKFPTTDFIEFSRETQ